MAAASFTDQLKNSQRSLFREATQHPFLAAAGKGTIVPEKLAAWLVQDEYVEPDEPFVIVVKPMHLPNPENIVGLPQMPMIAINHNSLTQQHCIGGAYYQHAYIPFIGHLLSKISGDQHGLPTTIFIKGQDGAEKIENNSLQHRIVDALISAIQALRIEESFYATTIRDYGLRERAKPSEPTEETQRYLDLFDQVGTHGCLLSGLTLLWATEYAYLNAWKYAASHSTDSKQQAGGKDPSAAVAEKLIPNWTSHDFEFFANTLEGLVNEIATQAQERDDKAYGSIDGAKTVWERALRCEKDFWPDV